MTALFSELKLSDHMARQRAELYMQMYKYAAEDFISIPDQNRYADTMTKWGSSVEKRLLNLGRELQVHTHEITPHVHAMPYHTHITTPHVHTSSAPGSPTSPELAPIITMSTDLTDTLPSLTMTNQVKTAFNRSELAWHMRSVPIRPTNTTGAVSNLAGNRIIKGTNIVGDNLSISGRRQLLIPILAVPDIPPIMKAIVTGGI